MPSPFADLLASLQGVLDAAGVRWYLFGAQAAILHGVSRLTADVDVTVDLGTRSFRILLGDLERAGFALRVPDSERFVERTRVLPLVHTASRMPLDLVLAGPGIEERFFERVVEHAIEGIRVPVAAVEDLIAMKVLAGRPKDLDDVAAILAAKGESIDLAGVRGTLRLLEGALDYSDLLPRFEQLVRGRR
jgi:hypothetical protein